MMRALLVPVLVLLAVGAAYACPVCFDSADPNVLRFYSISTMWLSFLPFTIVGGLGLAAWHLRRQSLRRPHPEY